MRRRRVMLVLVAAAALSCAALPAAAGAAQAWSSALTGTWRTAIEVPGTGALNKGGSAQVVSVSCASAGNCTVGGIYTDRAGREQAFVGSEQHGAWRKAIEVPGTAALNKGGAAEVDSVSCASAGNCLAGGSYTDRAGHQQAFVASLRNGTWHRAMEVPGTAALNKSGIAAADSVSCASAGNCLVGGSYRARSDHLEVFVASLRNGTWHRAIELPGSAALNTGRAAGVDAVSCASAGNCAAAGYYYEASGAVQAFVASQRNGTWHKAIEVPGTAALNKGRNAAAASVSCASAGNCLVGGGYKDRAGHPQAFVASEQSGTWHNAIEVPGTGVLNTGGAAGVESVSCASAGNCAVGGAYSEGSGAVEAFLASERDGTWQAAIEVPGTGALNTIGNAHVDSVSCASAGNCAAGGTYTSSSGYRQPFVVSQRNGTWQTAIEVPGASSLNTGGDAFLYSVSCASASYCLAGGSYADGSGHAQAFVASQSK
jgi:hypothetical protein